jgi:hypothetical protein
VAEGIRENKLGLACGNRVNVRQHAFADLDIKSITSDPEVIN